MARKVIVREQRRGCIWLCGVILIVCLAIYALAFALLIGLGVLIWFLMRGVWRSLVANCPDSKIVRFGMKMTPSTRKILAGIVSATAVIAIAGAVSAIAPQTDASAPSGEEQSVADKNKEEKGSSAAETKEISYQGQIDDFVNNFNSVSPSPFVQDTTFDPSDADSPYRPHRYNSPVYASSKGSHGTSGDFSLTVIACSLGLEISGTRTGTDYQSVADMIKTIYACEYPDADRTELDQKLTEFVGGDIHSFNYFDSNLSDSYADGDEFFLRLAQVG